MMKALDRRFALGLVTAGLTSLSSAQDAPKVTFADHVLPVLESKCVNCHNPDEAKGGLNLATYGAVMSGGAGGKVVFPEDPGASRLYTLTAHKEEPVMPPRGTMASEAELKVISDWIMGGLLETSSSKARKSDRPSLDLTSVTATGKPEGPAAMPEHLVLQPAVVTDRPSAVPALAHSPWAPIVAVAGQKQVLLYHSRDRDLIAVLPYPEGFPQTLSFTPNGAYLVCGGGRAGKSGNVVAWDIKTGERVIEVGKEYDIVLGADISPDLRGAVLGGPGRQIKMWDTVSGEQTQSIRKHPDWMMTAAYSPDGVLFATGDRNGGLFVWEAATGYEFHALQGHDKAVTDIAWRPDGNVLVSCGEDGQVILWEMNEGKQIKKWEAHPGGVQAITFSTDGNIATVGRDKTLKLWKGDGTAIHTINASNDIVMSVAYSDDGKRVFSGDWHGIIKVWNTENGAEIGTLEANPPTIEQQLLNSQARLAELNKQLPQLEQGIQTLSEELTKAKSDAAAATKSVADTTAAVQSQKAAVDSLTNQTNAAKAAQDAAAQQHAAKQQAIQQGNEALAKSTADLKTAQDALVTASASLKQKETAAAAAAQAHQKATAEAARPALTEDQQKQHQALAAALAAATQALQATQTSLDVKIAEHTALLARLETSKKPAADPAAQAAADKNTATLQQQSVQLEQAISGIRNTLAAQTAARQKADADFQPLREAAAAGKTRMETAQAALKLATDAKQAADQAVTVEKAAAAQTDGLVKNAGAQLETLKAQLAKLQQEAAPLAAALAGKQKAFNDLNPQLATATTELKKRETALAAAIQAKEQHDAKVKSVVDNEAKTRRTLEMAKAQLKDNQFLLKKWQAAAINLTAKTEAEAIDDMTGRLEGMMEEEGEARKTAEATTQSRAEAEQTLAEAQKTVETGNRSLREKSTDVLEKALQLVSNRAVVELKREVIGSQPGAESVPATVTNEIVGSPRQSLVHTAAQTMAHKTPEEISNEVDTLRQRLGELENLVKNTYSEAGQTRTMVVEADQVTRDIPQVIEERAKAEAAAARELADAEAERKKQENALEAQKKKIEELRAKYMATLPARSE